MTNYPTPANPLIVMLAGRPASLKNDKEIHQRNVVDSATGKPIIDSATGKPIKQAFIGKSPEVRTFIRSAQSTICTARERRGFDIVPMPRLIGALAVFFLHVPEASKTGLPTADDDNLWGTVQESLQEQVVCEDDGQVRDHRPVFLPAKARASEMTLLYVWSYEGNPFAPQNAPAFYNWFYSMQNPHYRLLVPVTT